MPALQPPGAEESALRTLLDRIVPAFLPQAVYLFASSLSDQANWRNNMIFYPSAALERLTVVAGYEAIRGSGVAADVIPTRRSRFER
jgi:hypothetical protein